MTNSSKLVKVTTGKSQKSDNSNKCYTVHKYNYPQNIISNTIP